MQAARPPVATIVLLIVIVHLWGLRTQESGDSGVRTPESGLYSVQYSTVLFNKPRRPRLPAAWIQLTAVQKLFNSTRIDLRVN